MENVNRWYFSKDQLANTPSRKFDIDHARELSYRQQAANFIQDVGQRLQLSQLCINTAIVYMHRFYVFHSFTEVHRNNLSISALFLAAKVEEQPRKLEHVIKVAHVCLHKDSLAIDVRSEAYAEKSQEVVAHENVLLQTLGFVLAIEHPHTYVVKVCQLVKASKDLAQSSYLMATTSLHMTTMCLQYKPTVVACVCIHLACKWSSYMIEPCSEGRDWFYYVDRTVTWELLERLTQEFIAILETSPHRFKRKLGKETAGFHNPKSIIENAAKEASASSEKRNGLSRKEPSPGPSTSLSFDFCPDFDEKAVLKFDGCMVDNNVSSKKAPVMPTSKKVPENIVNKKVDMEVNKKAIAVDISKKAPALDIKVDSDSDVKDKHISNHSEQSTGVKVKIRKDIISLKTKEPSQKNVAPVKPESPKHISNHSEQSTGIKVKIRKDIISLKTKEPSQKNVAPVKPESPKRSLKIKLPKPPVEPPKVAKPVAPASLKLVLTKDKSGTGSYSTKNRKSRKRSHSNATPPEANYKNSHEAPLKYQKVDHSQKSHSDAHGVSKPNKVSRHSSHRSNLVDSATSHSRLPHLNDATFHHMPNYQNYPYQVTPPPPFRGHNMMVGKTNSNAPLQPPLPPPQPPPPPPPPE